MVHAAAAPIKTFDFLQSFRKNFFFHSPKCFPPFPSSVFSFSPDKYLVSPCFYFSISLCLRWPNISSTSKIFSFSKNFALFMYKRLSETAISIFYKKNDLVLLANLQKKMSRTTNSKICNKKRIKKINNKFAWIIVWCERTIIRCTQKKNQDQQYAIFTKNHPECL